MQVNKPVLLFAGARFSQSSESSFNINAWQHCLSECKVLDSLSSGKDYIWTSILHMQIFNAERYLRP
jgi:hypothetical protein